MTDPKRKFELPGEPRGGWIVLIGGGEFSFGHTEEIDRFLISKLPPDNRRIAFLPTASGSSDYARHLGDWFREIDPNTETINVPIYRSRDARRRKNLDLLRSAAMVYVGGGVSNNLLEVVRDSPAEEALRDVVRGGGTVAAIGAAASAFGAVGRSMVTVGAPIEGFGWIDGALIEPGLRSPDEGNFLNLLRSPKVRIGVGIPEKTAIALDAERSGSVLGAGDVALVRKASRS